MRGLFGGVVIAAALAACPAAGQALPPLSYNWAVQAPDSEIADRVLGPLAQLYRDVSEPGSGSFSSGALESLQFATAPRSAGMPGLCESEVMWVGFRADLAKPFAEASDGGLEDQPSIIRGVRMDTRFAVAAQTTPTSSTEAYEASLDAACARLTDGWEFFRATDGDTAWLAVRATIILASQARSDPVAVEERMRWCGGEKCESLPGTLAGLSENKLRNVSAGSCEAFGFDLTRPTRDPRFRCMKLIYVLGAVANEFDVLEIAIRLDTGSERSDSLTDPVVTEFGALRSRLIED